MTLEQLKAAIENAIANDPEAADQTIYLDASALPDDWVEVDDLYTDKYGDYILECS